MRTITNSELSDFLQCRLKWKFSYKNMLTPVEKNQKLRLGSAIHLVIADCLEKKEFSDQRFESEYFKNFLTENITEEIKVEFDTWLYFARKVYIEMKELYKDKEILFIEEKIKCRIPKTEMMYMCKIDGAVRDSTGNWVIENKTTASYDSDYLFNLQINNQPTGYLWILNRITIIGNYKGIIYNIIQKPNKLLKDKKAWIDKNQLVHTEVIMRNEIDIKRWLKMMRDIACEFKRLKIYRSPSQDCRWKCAFKSLCVLGDISEFTIMGFRKKRVKYEQYENRGEVL